MNYPDIETDRFILKVMTADLVGPEYLSWFSNKATTKYIQYSQQEVTLQMLKDFAEDKLRSPEAIFLGIFAKSSTPAQREHIGNIKFEPIDFEIGFAVLGVLIGNSEWHGRGVFSEISDSLEDSLKKVGIRKILLGVEKENTAAVKAYLKKGYAVDEANFLKLDLHKAFCMFKELN